MAKLIAEKPIMASATPTMPRGMPMVQTAHPTNTRAYFVISIAISSLVCSRSGVNVKTNTPPQAEAEVGDEAEHQHELECATGAHNLTFIHGIRQSDFESARSVRAASNKEELGGWLGDRSWWPLAPVGGTLCGLRSRQLWSRDDAASGERDHLPFVGLHPRMAPIPAAPCLRDLPLRDGARQPIHHRHPPRNPAACARCDLRRQRAERPSIQDLFVPLLSPKDR
jgi:hypothetical protein